MYTFQQIQSKTEFSINNKRGNYLEINIQVMLMPEEATVCCSSVWQLENIFYVFTCSCVCLCVASGSSCSSSGTQVCVAGTSPDTEGTLPVRTRTHTHTGQCYISIHTETCRHSEAQGRCREADSVVDKAESLGTQDYSS